MFRTLKDVERSGLGEYAKEQIRNAFKKIDNRNTDTAPDGKPNPCMATIVPVEVYQGPSFNTPVRIHFHSVRKRRTDSDNVSGKAALDALVNQHVLSDDDEEYVPEQPRHTQEVSDIEKTIIEIEVIE